MRKDTFEVFHYREPRPGAVEVHHHDFYEVYYLLGGKVEYWVDGHIIAMEPGDLLLINPQELHRPIVDPESPVYERIVLWINREFLDGLQWSTMDLHRPFDGQTHVLRPDGSQRGALTARLGELVREYYSNEAGSDIAAYGLFLQLMVLLNRMASQGNTKQEEHTPLSPLVQKTLSYISENLNSPITLEQLATRFFVNKYYLSHAFSREVGVSIHRYILLRRLVLARQLMAAGESAGQACKACGFSDYTGFYRAFKSEYGISPREFTAGE
jgi:AraC-like DNA-binding protein